MGSADNAFSRDRRAYTGSRHLSGAGSFPSVLVARVARVATFYF